MLLFLGVVSSGRFFFLPNTPELRCLWGLPGVPNTPLSERLMAASSVSTVMPTADACKSTPAGIEGRPASSSIEGRPASSSAEKDGKPGKSPLNEFEGGSSPSHAWELNTRRRNAMVEAQRAARDCAPGSREKTRSERRRAQRCVSRGPERTDNAMGTQGYSLMVSYTS